MPPAPARRVAGRERGPGEFEVSSDSGPKPYYVTVTCDEPVAYQPDDAVGSLALDLDLDRHRAHLDSFRAECPCRGWFFRRECAHTKRVRLVWLLENLIGLIDAHPSLKDTDAWHEWATDVNKRLRAVDPTIPEYRAPSKADEPPAWVHVFAEEAAAVAAAG